MHPWMQVAHLSFSKNCLGTSLDGIWPLMRKWGHNKTDRSCSPHWLSTNRYKVFQFATCLTTPFSQNMNKDPSEIVWSVSVSCSIEWMKVIQLSWVEKHLPLFPNLIRWKIQTANWHTFYFSTWVYQRRSSLCVLEECRRPFAMSDCLYKHSQLNYYAAAVPSVRSAIRHVFISQ